MDQAPELALRVLPDRLAVCRTTVEARLPEPGETGFFSVTRTATELSIVLPEDQSDPEWTVERNWRALGVIGTLDFSLTGILARLSGVLADAAIPIFAVSTFDTDYLLVRDAHLADAIRTLEEAGFPVSFPK